MNKIELLFKRTNLFFFFFCNKSRVCRESVRYSNWKQEDDDCDLFRRYSQSNLRWNLQSQHNRICSLDFDDTSSIDRLIDLFHKDLTFIQLKSIVINQISSFKLLVLLFYLKSLPNLRSLSIHLIDCQDNIRYIYQMNFNHWRLSIQNLHANWTCKFIE